jgi:SAM-dependent methyltransferase
MSRFNFYDKHFYDKLNTASKISGEVIVPIVLDLLHPKSVIDIGCGQGEWLSNLAGTSIDYLGVDGDYISDEQLLIDKQKFVRYDLSSAFCIDRTFDVAMSLEVAEHLRQESSEDFVVSLTKLAPAVVFSAAVPGQGGVNHINEQWPSYWKQLFLRHGYIRLDAIRPLIWQNPQVAFYYRQNVFLFVDPSRHLQLVERYPVFDKYSELSIVKTTIIEDLIRKNRRERLYVRLRSFFRSLSSRLKRCLGL